MTGPAAPVPVNPAVQAQIEAAVAAALAQHAREQAAPAPADAPHQPQPNALSKGQLVSQTWEDDYAEGEQTRYGLVVEAVADTGEGPHAVVAWLPESSTVAESHLQAV